MISGINLLVRGTLFLIFRQAGRWRLARFLASAWASRGISSKCRSTTVFVWRSLGAEKSAQQSRGICRKCRVTLARLKSVKRAIFAASRQTSQFPPKTGLAQREKKSPTCLNGGVG